MIEKHFYPRVFFAGDTECVSHDYDSSCRESDDADDDRKVALAVLMADPT